MPISSIISASSFGNESDSIVVPDSEVVTPTEALPDGYVVDDFGLVRPAARIVVPDSPSFRTNGGDQGFFAGVDFPSKKADHSDVTGIELPDLEQIQTLGDVESSQPKPVIPKGDISSALYDGRAYVRRKLDEIDLPFDQVIKRGSPDAEQDPTNGLSGLRGLRGLRSALSQQISKGVELAQDPVLWKSNFPAEALEVTADRAKGVVRKLIDTEPKSDTNPIDTSGFFTSRVPLTPDTIEAVVEVCNRHLHPQHRDAAFDLLQVVGVPESLQNEVIKAIESNGMRRHPLAFALATRIAKDDPAHPWVEVLQSERDGVAQALESSPQDLLNSFSELSRRSHRVVSPLSLLEPPKGKVGLEVEFGSDLEALVDAGSYESVRMPGDPSGWHIGIDRAAQPEARRALDGLEMDTNYLAEVGELSLLLDTVGTHVSGFHLHFDRERHPRAEEVRRYLFGDFHDKYSEPTTEVRQMAPPLYGNKLDPRGVSGAIGMFISSDTFIEDTTGAEADLLSLPEDWELQPNAWKHLAWINICTATDDPDARLSGLVLLNDRLAMRKFSVKTAINHLTGDSKDRAVTHLMTGGCNIGTEPFKISSDLVLSSRQYSHLSNELINLALYNPESKSARLLTSMLNTYNLAGISANGDEVLEGAPKNCVVFCYHALEDFANSDFDLLMRLPRIMSDESYANLFGGKDIRAKSVPMLYFSEWLKRRHDGVEPVKNEFSDLAALISYEYIVKISEDNAKQMLEHSDANEQAVLAEALQYNPWMLMTNTTFRDFLAEKGGLSQMPGGSQNAFIQGYIQQLTHEMPPEVLINAFEQIVSSDLRHNYKPAGFAALTQFIRNWPEDAAFPVPVENLMSLALFLASDIGNTNSTDLSANELLDELHIQIAQMKNEPILDWKTKFYSMCGSQWGKTQVLGFAKDLNNYLIFAGGNLYHNSVPHQNARKTLAAVVRDHHQDVPLVVEYLLRDSILREELDEEDMKLYLRSLLAHDNRHVLNSTRTLVTFESERVRRALVDVLNEGTPVSGATCNNICKQMEFYIRYDTSDYGDFVKDVVSALVSRPETYQLMILSPHLVNRLIASPAASGSSASNLCVEIAKILAQKAVEYDTLLGGHLAGNDSSVDVEDYERSLRLISSAIPGSPADSVLSAQLEEIADYVSTMQTST